MINFNIENLSSLLEDSNVSKDELIAVITQIQFSKNVQEDIEPKNISKEGIDSEVLLQREDHCKGSCYSSLIPESDLKIDYKSEDIRVGVQNEGLDKTRQSTSKLPFNNTAFLDRIETYQRKREVRKKINEKIIRNEELRECSFKPQVNSNASKPSSTYTTERLLSNCRKEQFKMELERKEEMDISTHCTFQPVINSKPVKSRYMARVTAKGKKDLSETFNDGMFVPKIKEFKEGSEELKKYMTTDAYIRLSRVKPKKLLENANTECTKCSYNFTEFFARQNSFELKKNYKLKIAAIRPEGKPQINKRSREIAKNLLKSQDRRPIRVQASLNEECIFHPEILPQSKEMKSKNLNEMINIPLVQKKQKIDKLRIALLEKEAKDYTFQPKLETRKYSFRQPKSTIGISKETDMWTHESTINSAYAGKNEIIKVKKVPSAKAGLRVSYENLHDGINRVRTLDDAFM